MYKHDRLLYAIIVELLLMQWFYLLGVPEFQWRYLTSKASVTVKVSHVMYCFKRRAMPDYSDVVTRPVAVTPFSGDFLLYRRGEVLIRAASCWVLLHFVDSSKTLSIVWIEYLYPGGYKLNQLHGKQ